MKLTSRIIGSFVVCGAAALVLWKVGPSFRAKLRGAPPGTVVAPAQPAAAPAAASPAVAGLALERDHAKVFQRAFWRRPAPGDRVLHAERRDWMDASSGVEKWQWFIAVQPSAAFREWLLKENPFELVAVAADAPPADLSSPPDWFPAPAELASFTRYRNREGRYLVFHDVTTNRLFATDAGGGFAVARK